LSVPTWRGGLNAWVQTPWEGGVYKLMMIFPEDYPSKPPKCMSVSIQLIPPEY